MTKVQTAKFRPYIETHGAGEPLLLIPGFASGAWNWFRQTAELAADFRVVIFDPRGIGRSRAEGEDLRGLSMRTFVEDVRAVLDELEIERSKILGASFGGFVAQEFALAYPERVAKLILACTSCGGSSHVKPSIEILRSFTPDPSLSPGERIRKFIRPAFTERFNRDCAEEVEQVCRLREASEVAEAVYMAQLEAAFSFNSEERVGAVAHETLVITGDRDLVVPAENSFNLAARLPRATLKIIDGGSHMCFVENADRFNRAVKEFIKGN
jgi:pimeloyl-ACP methyl ester carboxylesterase